MSFENLPREIGIETLEDLPVDEAYRIIRLNPRLRTLYSEYLREVRELMDLAKNQEEIPPEFSHDLDIFYQNEYPIYQRQYIQYFIENTPTHITASLIQQLFDLCSVAMDNYILTTANEFIIQGPPFDVLKNRSHIYTMQNFWKGLNIKQLREILRPQGTQ